MAPIRKGDGTSLAAKDFQEVRKGDGTILWTALPDSEVTLPDGTSAYQWGDTKEWDDFSGWTQEVAGSSQIVSSPTQSGSNALMTSPAAQETSVIINDQSVVDSPTEGQVTSYWFGDGGDSIDIAGYFRFQNGDFLSISWNGLNNIRLNETLGGNVTTLDSLSAGSTPTSWTSLNIILWEDSGTLFGRIEDSDGNKIGGGDLSTTNHSITNGGGIGLGAYIDDASNGQNGDGFTDVTEVYYPE